MPNEKAQTLTVAEAFAETSKALQQFNIERIRVGGLSCGNACDEEKFRMLTEQEFMREFVFHSRPCIIVGALCDWPALQRWRDDRYLFDLDEKLPMVYEKERTSKGNGEINENDSFHEDEEIVKESDAEDSKNGTSNNEAESQGTLGPRRVTVALTPNGRADAVTYVTYNAVKNESQVHDKLEGRSDFVVTEKLFMSAAEVRVTLPELYRLLRANPLVPPLKSQFVDLRRPQCSIAYAQMQNNCLAEEYQHLHADIDTALDRFGTRVFGGKHEAANIWLGTPASVSSMHQDWVENLYAVVRGVKEFILVPPWEGVFVPKPELPAAAFTLKAAANCKEGEEEYIFSDSPTRDGTSVPWMDVELTPAAVDDPLHIKEELRDKLHPLIAYVQPGEVLYLPALWLHRVAQHADSEDSRVIEEASTEEIAKVSRHDQKHSAPLPLIAAVNYWYDMSFTNPAVVMLREFGLLL
ncbi:Cupin-like domain containing protein [Trypanosoma brucei equiperdum]|uniref:Cupin-like domain containing protein n=1 Tax=Trypanosoma brucei equiperdum TaxID=630700 RepID=A0A3L6L5L0_9TRYP|nr:Cupin-like domain containing protein [Trypanosoma brucei equiperdum]